MSISTDLIVAPFSEGLDLWSRDNGQAGSETYNQGDGAAFIPGDADFQGCLEITKSLPTEKLRYMQATPMVLERYIRVSARDKLIAGNMPSARIAGYALNSNDQHVPEVRAVGPSQTLDT